MMANSEGCLLSLGTISGNSSPEQLKDTVIPLGFMHLGTSLQLMVICKANGNNLVKAAPFFYPLGFCFMTSLLHSPGRS